MIFKLQQEAVHTDSEDEGSRTKISEKVCYTMCYQVFTVFFVQGHQYLTQLRVQVVHK